MALIDSHCHLQASAFDDDRASVLQQSLEQLDAVVLIGDTLESSEAAVTLAETSPRIFAAVGIHPHNAREVTPDTVPRLRELSQHPQVVAIGEIGLDYYYDFSPREQQRDVFRLQLELAAELNLPIVIHCRDAQADLAEVVDPMIPSLSAKGVMHCFPGDAAFARQSLDWGFYISYAGNVTFPKAVAIREAALVTPLDRLLVETDAPYLAPVPKRGKRCEPGFVHHTAAYLAGLKGVPLDELSAAAAANTRRVFFKMNTP